MAKYINADDLLNMAMAEEVEAKAWNEDYYENMIKITELMKIVDEVDAFELIQGEGAKVIEFKVIDERKETE